MVGRPHFLLINLIKERVTALPIINIMVTKTLVCLNLLSLIESKALIIFDENKRFKQVGQFANNLPNCVCTSTVEFTTPLYSCTKFLTPLYLG